MRRNGWLLVLWAAAWLGACAAGKPSRSAAAPPAGGALHSPAAVAVPPVTGS